MNLITKSFRNAVVLMVASVFAFSMNAYANGEIGGVTKVQLIHAADFEASTGAIETAPRFGAIVDYFDMYAAQEEGVINLMLTSGDNYLPGPFMSAAGDRSMREVFRAATGNPSAREGNGRADIEICNILGVEASSIGNHEFDLGTDFFASLAAPDVRGGGAEPRWMGAQFPYLSANLDFSGDGNLNGIFTNDILPNTAFQTSLEDAGDAPSKPSIAPATIIEKDGVTFGLVGATTPIVQAISSTGGVVAKNPGAGTNDMMALAQILQPTIDELINQGIDKIIVLSHLQQLSLEEELIGYLNGVDIVIGGGSNSILADANDRLKEGDMAVDTYPIVTTNADNDPALIVNTDGSYNYVGRLVFEFDQNGVVLLNSLDNDVNGAYATDDETLEDLFGDAEAPFEVEGSKAQRIKILTDGIRDVIVAKDGNTFGWTNVWLEGRREYVRTQETNLGNLTADANLWTAKMYDENVMVSHKNGGGIRAEIGNVVAAGAGGFYFLSPPLANPLAGKREGEISQLDLENTMRFNNGLTLLTVTAEQLVEVVEHAVAGSNPGSTPGQFGQFSGIKFVYDWNLPAGDRVLELNIVDDMGNVKYQLVHDGEFVGDADMAIRMVTLNFLAGGGDNYPFDDYQAENPDFFNRVDLAQGEFTGEATFAEDGSEQDALAEYLYVMYPDKDHAFNKEAREGRIVNAALGSGEVEELSFFELASYHTGIFDESAAEIIAYNPEDYIVYVTNSFENHIEVMDITNPDAPLIFEPIDISAWGGVNSIAFKNGVLAVALENPESTQLPGTVAFFNAEGEYISEAEVGPLPDMVTFTPDGRFVLTANEGEPNDDYDNDPEGSISVIEIEFGAEFPLVRTADFLAFNDMKDELIEKGVRIFGPNATVAQDLEPEYITINAEGTIAYVSLQENNALAVVDILEAEVIDIVPLGYKNWMLYSNTFDASNRDDQIRMKNWPTWGMYQPDALASFEFEGRTFIVSANEGDARDYDGYSEEDRVGDLPLDPMYFPDAANLQNNVNLGRLNTTLANGDTDGDGLYEKIYSYGARSFSIWDENGNLIWDSADEFETILADLLPDEFNSNNDENYSFDARSDDKGPEPEGITVGRMAGKTYAFITMERIGGVMVYNITDPYAPRFVNYFNNRDFSIDFSDPNYEQLRQIGDLGPEDVKFIPAEISPNGDDLVIVSNEVSGSVSIWAAYHKPLLNLDDVTTCYGDPVGLGNEMPIMYGSGDFEIEWSPSNGLDLEDPLNPMVINPVNDRSFTMTVYDNMTGEIAQQTIELHVMDAPDVEVPLFIRNDKDGEVDLNEHVSVNGEGEYMNTWRDNGGMILEPAVVSPEPGLERYFVTVTDEMGCNSVEKRLIVFTSFRKESQVVAGLNGTGVMEAYPTPVSNELTVIAEFFDAVDAEIKLVDLNGKEVFTMNVGGTSSIFENVDVSQINSGVYMLVIETANDRLVQKVVKQ